MSGRTAVRTRRNKERSKNFSELEKSTVLELIAQHREVLRQGRSNNATNKSKQMVWSQICMEVNKRCRAENPRTPAQVKMWYENYKKKCKMRFQEPTSAVEESGSSNLLEGRLWTINPLTVGAINVKDERRDLPASLSNPPPDDLLPVDMSSDRVEAPGSRDMDCKDGIHMGTPLDVLETRILASPSTASPATQPDSPLHDRRILAHTVIATNPNSHIVNSDSEPMNLHLEPRVCVNTPSPQNDLYIPSVNLHSRCANINSFPQKKCGRGIYSRTSGNSFQENACCNTGTNDSTSSPHNNNNNVGNYYCSNPLPTEEEKLYFIAKRKHALSEHEARMKILNMELRQKEEIFSLQKQLFLIELKLKMDFLEKNCNK